MKRRGRVRHRDPYWAIAADAERAVKGGAPDETRRDEFLDDADREDVGPHRRVAVTFFDRVRKEVTSVDALYLFGSVARDTTSSDSDVDVLAVVADDADFADVDDQLLDLAYDVQLEPAVTVEVHSVAAESEARRRHGEPFVRTVVEEGVPMSVS